MAFLQDQIEKVYGTTTTGNWKPVTGKMDGEQVTLLFDSKSHQYRYPNGQQVPREMLDPSHWKQDVSQTVDAKTRPDYEDAKKECEDENPGKTIPGHLRTMDPLANGYRSCSRTEARDSRYAIQGRARQRKNGPATHQRRRSTCGRVAGIQLRDEDRARCKEGWRLPLGTATSLSWIRRTRMK